MPGYFLIAALFCCGQVEEEAFEGWPGYGQSPPPETVRAVGTYPTRLLKEGDREVSFYVLVDPPQLHFAARGPLLVVLKIRGCGDGEVSLQIDLDASKRRRRELPAVAERSREVFLRVPAGMHLFSLVASRRVLVRLEPAVREPEAAGAVVDWDQPDGEPAADSTFWKYQPDLSKIEWKEERPPRRWDLWLNAGAGAVVQLDSSTAGIGMGGSVNFRIDHYLVMIRSTYNLEMSVLGPEPSETHWEVGPLFGLVLRGRVGWISGAAGVGVVGGLKRGKLLEHGDVDKYAGVDFLAVGFPLDVQLFLRPPSFSCFGLGLDLYANLSPEYSVFGLMLSVMVGL